MSRADIERDGVLVRVKSFAVAQSLLRLRDGTRQAGFTAEYIPRWLIRHRPILIADGPEHDEQRKRLARFFAPRVLEERHLEEIRRSADRIVERARTARVVAVDEVALEFSVHVASTIIGLDPQRTRQRARRLTRFFRQPPVDPTRDDLGRSRRQWAQAALRGLLPIASFYVADVRPAIRSHRSKRRADIISHLLDQGYGSSAILMECLTYATAGMITTREFMTLALWTLLTDGNLRNRFESGTTVDRSAILHEIIRLEPPVGHLFRRAERDLEVGCPFTAGQLVGVDVRAANTDEHVYGTNASNLDPHRDLPSSERAGLSFGDGAHRCPGQPLAMMETQELLVRLLRERPVIDQQPAVGWNSLVEGYELRGFTVRFGTDPATP